MADVKPFATPMSLSQVLTLLSGHLLPNPSEYRATVGSLQYLGLTCPDIAFAVNRLSQYMHQPRTLHWEAVKRLLRYLAVQSIKDCSSRPLLHLHFMRTLMLTGQANRMTTLQQVHTSFTLADNQSFGLPRNKMV